MASSYSPSIVVALRDGTSARVRLIRRGDRDRVMRGVEEMSGTSRYLRFFASTRRMSAEQARYFTDIDQVNHVAVCAVEPTLEESRGYGIARFVRDQKDSSVAEFAIAVIDSMQQRGLGTCLMAAMYLRAQALGVRELRGEVLAENPVVPRWLPRLGAALRSTSEPEYQQIIWPVRPGGDASIARSEISQSFLVWLDRLRSGFGEPRLESPPPPK